MHKKTRTAAYLSIRYMHPAYVTTAVILLMLITNYITSVFVPGSENNMTVSAGDIGALLCVLAAIFIPTHVFRRLVNLGGKRVDYYKGCAAAYVVLAAASGFICLIAYYTADLFILRYIKDTLALVKVFGFIQNGPVVAYFQYASLMLLLMAFTHTLVSMQDKWYGWATDVLIVTIISVFTPIAPLRAVEVAFFRMIIFQPNALLQIISCVVLAVCFFGLGIPVVNRKAL